MKQKITGTEAVNAYMAILEHPFKTEVETIRQIILQANPKMQERVKWNSPSFYYQDKDFAAFHLRAKDGVQLIIVFHDGAMIQDRMELLEGDYKDRRIAKFANMEDVQAKKDVMEKVVNLWINFVDGNRNRS